MTHTKEELDRRYLDAQGRLADAQAREADARHGSLEREQAHEEVMQATDDLSAVEHERARVARSVAERFVRDLEGYSIEEEVA